MKKQKINLFLYRWRYVIGYIALAIIFVLALVSAGLYAPGGLTQFEIDNLKPTNQISLSNPASLAIPNLPLHLLQKASLELFGVSILSIKLPSFLLAVITAVSLFFLVRRWFKPNVTILSLIIMTITGQFIFVAQSATPHILYVTYASLILLFATLITQRVQRQLLWKICLAITMALSLFTPYFIFINLIILAIAMLHPHTRHQITRKEERASWVVGGAIFAVLLIGLIYLICLSPNLLTDLLGYQSFKLEPLQNAKTLIHTYFWVTPIIHYGQIVPIMDFSSLALMVLGLIATLKNRHTARAYIVFAWLIVTLPLILVRPQLTILIAVPLFILLAVGIEALLSEWYGLFPKNPYARATGLVMLVGLIGVMILSGGDRFFNSYRYMPEAVHASSTDLMVVQKELTAQPDLSGTILSNDQELPLYQALTNNLPNIKATTDLNEAKEGKLISTRTVHQLVDNKKWQLEKILTNDLSVNGDRFYIYKPVVK